MKYIEPDPSQLEAFFAEPDDGPIVMVNLLKFNGDAGRAMYADYVRRVTPMIATAGGRLIYRGKAGPEVIGADGWDEVILGEYPTRRAMMEMLQSDDYQAVAHLRHDALLDSRLICTHSIDE